MQTCHNLYKYNLACISVEDSLPEVYYWDIYIIDIHNKTTNITIAGAVAYTLGTKMNIEDTKEAWNMP